MARWWGEHEIGVGSRRRWAIGTLDLWVACLPREWQLAHDETPGAPERWLAEGPDPGLVPPDGADLMRFSSLPGDEHIGLQPCGADRPVVVRPDRPLGLPAGEQVTFFVSTPTWLNLVSPRNRILLEIPVIRPSDTWFGASPREGELCYASRTSASLFLADLPQQPGRVVTEVRVRNQGLGMMGIERVHIPMPSLGIFANEANVLWTPSVTVVRQREQPLAEVRIENAPPSVAGRTQQIAPARRKGVGSIFVRALGALLS